MLEQKIQHIKSHIPFDMMTWEEFIELYPDRSPNFLKNPTFWPHTPEEQIIKNSANKEEEKK